MPIANAAAESLGGGSPSEWMSERVGVGGIHFQSMESMGPRGADRIQ